MLLSLINLKNFADCLMNNEFMKVFNEPKTILLLAAMQRKQQRCTFEIL